jgi:hypothetical protein
MFPQPIRAKALPARTVRRASALESAELLAVDAGFGGKVGGYHENRLNVSRLQKNRFKPSPDQAGVQPLRQRICFEPDPRNREAKSFNELDTVSVRW